MRIPVKLDQTQSLTCTLPVVDYDHMVIHTRYRITANHEQEALGLLANWAASQTGMSLRSTRGPSPPPRRGAVEIRPPNGLREVCAGGGGGARLCGSLPAMPRERVLSPNYPVKVRGSPHMPFFSHSDTEAHNTVPQGIHHNNSEQHRGPRKDTQAFK